MKNIYFFIGTEAELIKVFPVITHCQKLGKICHIIASGQNDLKKSRILSFIELNGCIMELSDETEIKKSAVGLFQWFLTTRMQAVKKIRKYFDTNDLAYAPLVVHGDTVSTFMGAMLGKKLKMKVCHVEAGLRSHNLFNPFPEEIDRLLTSSMARVHFAPGDRAVNNLKKAKGTVINTEYNTILDSLAFSKTIPIVTEKLEIILSQDYFVFVMHRQENLMNRDFFKQVLDCIKNISKDRKCVLILHEITKNGLIELGELDQLILNDNFYLLPRVDYFDFMKLLDNAKFVITDGGSNQEELHYMGKPCLIMRKTTERNEGIGQNARLFGGSLEQVSEFAANYQKYECDSVSVAKMPSRIIAERIAEL